MIAAFAAILWISAAGAVRSDEGFQALMIDGAYVQWEPPSADRQLVLRYALADHAIMTPGAVNCGKLHPARELMQRSALSAAALKRAASDAFARWQRVAAITFVEVANQDAADIVIGAQGEPQGFAFTNLTLAKKSDDAMRPITGALICLNPEKRWKVGFDGNIAVYDLVHTLTHEIGHAIGLDHPNGQGHLMSFHYDEAQSGLSAGDVRGAVQLYGAAVVPDDDRLSQSLPAPTASVSAYGSPVEVRAQTRARTE